MMKAILMMPAVVLLLGGMAIGTSEPAAAVVYCKTAGVPKGCVARVGAPVVRRVVAKPRARARGAVVRPGTPMNRGGPVNRPGRR